MSKEELEKEAYRWTEKNISVGISMYNPNIVMYCRKAYKDSAEPREKQIQTLGERCNQLLKDKGNLTDELQELKETLAHTIENDEVAYETLKLHEQEENGILNSKITKLEQQIEKMKSIGRTAYIKGIRTMANALKDYDRTEGVWTDYFEHTVEEVLKRLLKESK